MEPLFQFLFKFRPLLYQKGQIAFGAAWPTYALVLVIIIAGLVAFFTYARVRADVPRSTRIILAAIRTAALIVIGVCLMRPTLLVSTALPRQNYVAVLIDDSRSMRLPGTDGKPRGAFVQQQLGANGALLKDLAGRYTLRTFKFSSGAEKVSGTSDMTYAGDETQLGHALDHVRQEMAGVPLAGIVVVTDGADNSSAPLSESLLSLRNSSVPVFTVGVGPNHFTRDVQIGRVQAPRRVLKGSTLVVDVPITQRGYAGHKVPLTVEDGGRIVSEQEIELPADGATTPVRVHFTATEDGDRTYKFRIASLPGELVTQNNSQDAFVTVEDRRDKILYFEGQPRWELKFVRRAVVDDPNLQLVVLQRTADEKFLRLDVDNGQELVAGFPTTREELFAYRGVIIGSVEASFFTHAQLQLLADFASKRGGGLMFIGGSHAFAEGGYEGTPLADAMPVIFEKRDADPTYKSLPVKVMPTRIGATHPATQLGGSERESTEHWAKMPELTTVNFIHRAKPGATVLLTSPAPRAGENQVVLAAQRYGKGRTIALTPQDTWLWHMDAAVPLADKTYETFWRQLLRWLVSDVADPVYATVSTETPLPHQPVTVFASVEDSTFNPVNDAGVTLSVTEPSGARTEVPMEWTVSKDGEYRATFTPSEPGAYDVKVNATRKGASLGTNSTFVSASAGEREYFDAEMREPLLQRIAKETGGRFYTPSNVSSLPEDIRYSGGGSTSREEMDLWDMPFVFLLLIALLGAEWGVRRAKGLA